MKFISAKCPSCHGDLQVPDDRDFVICMYCGTTVKIREAVRVMLDSNIPNLNNLGIEALKAGNYQEAYDYFSKVLESDSNNSQAWYNKALACGSLSSLGNNRDSEMNSYFEKSIKCTPEEKTLELKNKIAEELHNFNLKFFDKIKKNFNEDITNANLYSQYIENCIRIIKSLENAMVYNPNQVRTINFLKNIANDNMKEIHYKVLSRTPTKAFYEYKKHCISPAYRTYLRDRLKVWEEKLILLDSSYKESLELIQKNKLLKQIQSHNQRIELGYTVLCICITGFMGFVIMLFLTLFNINQTLFTILVILIIISAVVLGIMWGSKVSKSRKKA